MIRTWHVVVAALLIAGVSWAWAVVEATESTPPAAVKAHARTRPAESLAQAIGRLQIPPAWMETTKLDLDIDLPAKENNKKVMALMAAGDLASRRQVMKAMYLYKLKGEVKALGMWLYWGGQIDWAAKELKAELAAAEQEGKPVNLRPYMALAGCHRHFGEYDKAVKTLQDALKKLSAGPRQAVGSAHLNTMIGDILAETGRKAEARTHYDKAIEGYETVTRPRPRKFAQISIGKVRTKLAMLDATPLKAAKLRDGVYTGTAHGYVSRIEAAVTVTAGKVSKIDVKHKETFPSDAPKEMPRRIIAAGGLNVDIVTGATFTSDAIRMATFDALTKAGGN